MTKILIPAILNSYRPLRDKSFSINIVINEPNAEQKVIIDRLFQQACYVLIKSGEINTDEKAMMDVLEPKKGYSQSQKLRFAIEDLRKRDEPMGDPEVFYQNKMNQIIDWINKK